MQTLLATMVYWYNNAGNVTQVVTEKEDHLRWESRYTGTRLVYARNGRAVAYVLGETWGNEHVYDIAYAR